MPNLLSADSTLENRATLTAEDVVLMLSNPQFSHIMQDIIQQVTQQVVMMLRSLPTPHIPPQELPGWNYPAIGEDGSSATIRHPQGIIPLVYNQPTVDLLTMLMANASIAQPPAATSFHNQPSTMPMMAQGNNFSADLVCQEAYDFEILSHNFPEYEAMQAFTDAVLGPPATSHSVPIVEPLEQTKYHGQQPVKGIPAGPIYFNRESGVLLHALDSLEGQDTLAFLRGASIGVKASLRFGFPGFEGYSNQVRVRRGSDKYGLPISLRELGERVGVELKKMMNHAQAMKYPLTHNGVAVRFEDVVLLRIEHVSQGTFYPILGVIAGGA